jgi:hypothetical protein
LPSAFELLRACTWLLALVLTTATDRIPLGAAPAEAATLGALGAAGPIAGCPDLVWGSLPDPGRADLPDREALCSAIPGEPLPEDLWPPLALVTMDDQNEYAARLRSDFLEPRRYATELGWIGDAHWRLSGDFAGCPSDSTFASFGVHLLVRVWYSPEVVAWLCSDRTTELPDGAMIIKEEHFFQGAGNLLIDPVTHRAAPAQDLDSDIITFMIKRAGAAWDGYYWGAVDAGDVVGNPPIVDRAGLSGTATPPPLHLPAHAAPFYPTGSQDAANGSATYANYGYGMYCVNCHSAAQSEQTFSAIANILGQEHVFSWLGRSEAPTCNGDETGGLPIDPGAGHTVVGPGCPPELPPAPLVTADPKFVVLYHEVHPISDDEVWLGVDIAEGTGAPPDLRALRYPAAQSWDRSVMPAASDPKAFLTSDQCVGCHDGIRNNSVLPYMVLREDDGRLRNLSPGSEWRNSSMGIAGRDPIFMARMEAEWNHVERDFAKVPGLGEVAGPTVADCVMDLCLSCHAKAGHLQQSMDTKGTGTEPLEGSVLQVQNTFICRDLLPAPLARGLKTKNDGHQFFVRPNLQDWPGEDGVTADQVRAGALGRDGVTCVACHLAGPDVGNPADGFTGNIPYLLDGYLFGPDAIGAPGEIMNAAIGLQPTEGAQLRESRLCGTCHAINLPVLRSGTCTTNPETSPFEGCVERFDYEQTTYFEYLNSAYAPGSPSAEPGLLNECQGCHMQNGHGANGDEPLAFKVANIQDDSFYRYDNSRSPEALALPVREDYRRHAFPGLNLFVNALQQQFPLLLGHADFDWMNVTPEMGVITQRDTLLDFAREQTASIAIEDVQPTTDGLRASVRVENLAGHNLPSGVGFRRLFIEFSVLDRSGNVLWVSGRTDALGQLLGANRQPLASEHYPSGAFEPHHQVIRSQDEVQIYEEVVADEDGNVTTGFLHRWTDLKDNRIPPRGFRWDSAYVEAPYDVAPKGDALLDPDYFRDDPTEPLDGSDAITYEVPVPAAVKQGAASVRARLISQSTPPYFLSQIFAELAVAQRDPTLVATERQLIVDGSLLHYLLSRFDASAVDASGEPYLKDWKLEIAADAKPVRIPLTPIRPGTLPRTGQTNTAP